VLDPSALCRGSVCMPVEADSGAPRHRYVPPDPGTAVRALAGTDRERALFRDQMNQALAVGLDRTNRPVWADWEFLNAALKVVGRLDAGDTADYCFLSSELRQRATRILPGAMIVNQPVIPESLLVHYPFPPYATCQDEADMTPDDDQRARLDSIFDGG
jgi:hypothetical protein